MTRSFRPVQRTQPTTSILQAPLGRLVAGRIHKAVGKALRKEFDLRLVSAWGGSAPPRFLIWKLLVLASGC